MVDTCTLREPVFEYMQYEGGGDKRSAIYRWIKDGLGEFDVNDTDTPIPSKGVSVRESDDKIVIAAAMGGTYTVVNEGDYVLKGSDGQFFVFNAAVFNKQYRP